MANNFTISVPKTPADRQGGQMNPEWNYIFNVLSQYVSSGSQYGPTANRPTGNVWIGMMYFDQTLGYPVFLKTIASPNVWVNGAGTHV
jgi:hypothetical protein